MRSLVIVESPTKAKTISKILGKNYVVKSSMGHVRDLPKSELGVNVEENFTPKYITIRGKGSLIKTLKDEAKKADRIYLASDPDREGEAIAWHLQQYLGIKEENCRIEFNEITDQAVKKAVQSPHPIDMDRVDAQQVRRILDRLVGYKISPLLWKKVKKGLSAGRVQSVVVRLICDREDEIKNFVSEEYWTLLADLKAKKGTLTAKLHKIDDKKPEIANKEKLDEILDYLKDVEYLVDSVKTKEKRRNATPPFTTSSMQQDASRILNMAAKKTMQTAQQLYEGIAVEGNVIGLITYMRTDSVRISDEAQNTARDYIERSYGKEYLPSKPNIYKNKGKIQNAHEAIRPTFIERTPASLKPYLTPQQYKLYKLIWERFISSQMSQALYDVTTVIVKAGKCQFRASGEVMRFAGFLEAYGKGLKTEDNSKEEEGVLVPVEDGEALNLLKFDPQQHFTQPSPRYTEAALVKALEELGIGRPSTYAPIIDTILARGYVVKEDKHFFPTELGVVVVDLMKEYFSDIINVEFTAGMERQLDMVEEGEAEWIKLLDDFYRPFSKTLEYAEKEMEKVTLTLEETGEMCEKCGKPMVYRMGKYGRFQACSGFPECRNTKPIMTVTDIKCLACGGHIVQRKSRSGRIFYGCDNYPECKFVSWDMPIDEVCPECGTQMSEKTMRGGVTQKLCPNKDCPTKKKKAVKEGGEKKTTAKKSKTSTKKTTAKKTSTKKTTAKSKKAEA